MQMVFFMNVLIGDCFMDMFIEEQLILFHHSCYYKMEDTKNCINVYYTLRIGTPEYFVRRDVTHSSLQQALSVL